MPLPKELRGEAWAPQTARKVIPLLVSRAKRNRPLTYTQLDEEIVARGWGKHAMVVGYGNALDLVGLALERTSRAWKEPIPPLNALVVTAATKVPGGGCASFIAAFARSHGLQEPLTPAENLAVVQELHEMLSEFPRWDELLREYGLEPLEGEVWADPDGTLEDHRDYGQGGPESEAHRQLKEYIAAKPQCVDASTSWIGLVEHQFRSGDTVDVLLASGLRGIAVEVKSADADGDEQVRGVYQCVKYQALLRATQRVRGFPPTGRAVLVLGGKPSVEARETAKALDIRIIAPVVVPKPPSRR